MGAVFLIARDLPCVNQVAYQHYNMSTANPHSRVHQAALHHLALNAAKPEEPEEPLSKARWYNLTIRRPF
jgi:hypothetical protein